MSRAVVLFGLLAGSAFGQAIKAPSYEECLLAAIFRVGGAWFDVARVDTLFLFFLLAGGYAARVSSGWRGAAFAGLLMAFAFFTKQSALVEGAFVAIACFAGARTMSKRGARGLARFSLLAGLLVFLAFFGGSAFASSVGGVAGLWVAVVMGWVWLAIVSRYYYRVSPDPSC